MYMYTRGAGAMVVMGDYVALQSVLTCMSIKKNKTELAMLCENVVVKIDRKEHTDSSSNEAKWAIIIDNQREIGVRDRYIHFQLRVHTYMYM